jgi:hypothetical protein
LPLATPFLTVSSSLFPLEKLIFPANGFTGGLPIGSPLGLAVLLMDFRILLTALR